MANRELFAAASKRGGDGGPRYVGVVASATIAAVEAADWGALNQAERFIVVMLFGASAERKRVAPAWQRLRDHGFAKRDVAARIRDETVRRACQERLDYTNRC